MKKFLPLDRILERVTHNGMESDTTRFWELTYAGEFIVRLTTAIAISCVNDSRDRDRYGLEYRLVRADGIGEWVQSLEQVLTGPPAAHLHPQARPLRNALTERMNASDWRAEAVKSLLEVLKESYDPNYNVKESPSLRLWFNLFVQLRNKARGHGAPTPAKLSSCVESLQNSIQLVFNNLPIREIDCAYLHRNLSGRYRVINISDDKEKFSYLKTAAAHDEQNFESGIYIWLGAPRRVNLIFTDQDCVDYFFPNGDFKKNDFEIHSLITDDRRRQPNTAFLAPASSAPDSETAGREDLDIVGSVFTNMPPIPQNYINRKNLEDLVTEVTENDRHPIVTLVGRGGIGKTSLTLKILHDISYKNRFSLIVWFSARDIDLISSGAKQVRPSVLTEKEISIKYMEITGHKRLNEDGSKTDPIEYMSSQLNFSDFGPTLFVFDNFETLRSPQDIYNWIDTSIRLPNKALITSRFRDFKGDYPIEIPGMDKNESRNLADATAQFLGISSLLSKADLDTIIDESDGHPYIIKILLGEIADKGTYSRPSKLIARRDDVLNALFERTFGSLPPLGARIFMTLSQWRSVVPQLVVEAALSRHAEGGIDPETAIDQLVRTSLVERTQSQEKSDHLSVPLSAAIFGKAKLEVAANRALIMDDVRFLQLFGASTVKGNEAELLPRIRRFFSDVAKRIEREETSLSDNRSVLEFLARGYSETWLLLSRIEADSAEEGWKERSAEYIRRYLQDEPSGGYAQQAWQDLEAIYKKQDDAIAACGAFLRIAEFTSPPLERISSMASWLNASLKTHYNLSVDERAAVFMPLAKLLEQHIQSAGATDLSRLGWLYLHCGNVDRAREVADLGLNRDSSNIYCARLLERLDSASRAP